MRGTTDTNSERGTMRISARNVLKGTITDVEIGAVSGVVSIKVGETALTSSSPWRPFTISALRRACRHMPS